MRAAQPQRAPADGTIRPAPARAITPFGWCRSGRRRRVAGSGSCAVRKSAEECDNGQRRQCRTQPVEASVGIFLNDRVGGCRPHAGLIERSLEIFVGEERDTSANSTWACRGRDSSGRRDCPVTPLRNDDVSAEIEHRACERGADRRAEVRHRVLQAADFAALLVGYGTDRDAAELRRRGARRRDRRGASAR